MPELLGFRFVKNPAAALDELPKIHGPHPIWLLNP
jgi:hypothetical protein